MITSSIPFGFADVSDLDIATNNPTISSTPKESRVISVSLNESVGLSSNSPNKKNLDAQSAIIASNGSFERVINLSESLDLTTSMFEQSIEIYSSAVQPQITFDRVSQIDKLKDRKKNSKLDQFLAENIVEQSTYVSSITSISDSSLISHTPIFVLNNNFELHELDLLSISENLYEDISSEFISSVDQLTTFATSTPTPQYFLVILTPFVFFVLLRSEDFEFNLSKLHQPLAFVFALLILSGGAITPFAIGESYWPMAYADDTSIDTHTTSSEDSASSSSTPAEDTESSDSTSDNTSTPVDSASSSSTPAEDSDSTGDSSSTHTTSSEDSASSSSTPAEDTESSDSTSDNTSTPVDSASSSSTPAEDSDSTGDSSSTHTTSSEDSASSSSTPAEDTESSDSTSDNTSTPVDSASSSSTPAEDSDSTGDSSSQSLIIDGSIQNLGTNTTSTEVIPTNTTSTEVIPTNTTSTEVIPTNTTSTEVIPTNTTSTEVIPTNTTSTEVIPTNTTSTEVIPTNTTSTEVIPTNTTSTEVIPTNTTSTEVIPTNTTSTEVIPTNTTSTEVIPTNTTSTEVIPTNTTSTEVIPTNTTSTEVIPGTNSTEIPVNGTVIPGTNSTEIPVNGTVIPGTNSTEIPVNGTVIPGTNSTEIPVNGTVIPGTNSTEIPVVVPNATESWQFDTQINGSRFIGDVYIQTTNSSLILEGDGYVANDGNSTSDLSNISITAWVNPDYDGGSAEFTVISKEKAFSLTINNNIAPQHIATFSVFDGIKWHSVDTTTTLGENWSHLAATFNGTILSIYTNGTLSNTNESVEKIELTIDGQLEAKTIETVSSTSDIIIGATLENQRTVDDVTKRFHGEIKEVNIFDVYLTAEQVEEIYLQTLPLIEQLYNNTQIEIVEEEPELVAIDILAQRDLANANATDITTNATDITTNATDITTNATDITTNATETVITFNTTESYIPVEDKSLNEELNQLTISTWINPSYESGSAEYSVVSKENSFNLGINNIYAPERIPTFAVFDGITWTEISGVTEINGWTNLVAVINNTKISLYVNGELEAQDYLPESFALIDGEMSPTPADVAENNSDLIIGAYLSTLREQLSLSNHFSGTIDDVLIYKEALSEAQISEIYAGYVTPSVHNEIPFESQLLTFSDSVTVFLNNESIYETIHVAAVDITTPTTVQSIAFGDYVSYKLNGNSNESSIEVITISDIVVATVIPSSTSEDDPSSISEFVSISDIVVATVIPSSTSEDDPSSISEDLSIDDNVIALLNGIGVVHLSESLSFDASLTIGNNTTLSDAITSNIQLEHDTIEINKPVTWTHDVIFSNDTESIAVEIPADAEILMVKSFNDTSESIIFDYTEFDFTNSTGLFDDEDISEKDLKKYFRLIDSVKTVEAKINKTTEKIAYYANLDTAKAHKKLDKLNDKLDKLEGKLENKLEKLSNNIPLASLQQVGEMIQEDKPLKVLLLNSTDSNIELTFTTPAAYTVEENNSTNDKFDKKVTVAHESALHYTNVTAFTDIPEDLVLGGTEFRLFWHIKSPVNATSITNSTTTTRVDVTDDPRFAVHFVDTDGNGVVDRMQWTVPQLSEQEFDIEADLEIINVQSYPAVGGNWKVRFTTNGTADLIITAVNGTTFGSAKPDDLKFLELNNGTHTLTPIVNGNTITYYNYSSTEEGFEESQVLTPFKHHLMFQFGNKTAFAHNNAFVPNGPEAILLYGDPVVLGSPDTEDDMAISNPVIPGWDEAADRKDPIYTPDETGGGCNGIDDSCTEIEVSEAGTYRVNYGLSYEKSTISASRYQAVSFVQNDTTGSNGYNNGDGMSCFDSVYIRSTDNHRTGVLSGECLVELDAGGKVRVGTSKVSSTTGSGTYTFADDESWFAMQKVENPTISLRANGASITINNTPDDLTFVDADVVTHDTGTFTFDGSSANAEVTVNDDGLYKVTYSALLENPNNRASIIGKVQTNTSGSFVDDIYGGSISYNRNTDGITDSALSASTILELNSGDEIKVVLVDETTRTSTATAYHLDIEYLGTNTDANVLRVYNSTGNLNLDTSSDVLIDWDKANEIGSHFTFTGDVPPVHGPFNFTADNDADESAWTFVSDNGNDGLLPSGSTRSWSHETDATPSGTTTVGPNFGQGGDDVTPEGYVYTEATSPATFGDTFHMTLNEVLNAEQYDWNVDFYWNQKGDNNLATVELQVNEGGAGWVTIQTFAESGPDRTDSESSIWRHENVDLTTISDPSTQVRFFVEFPASGLESWNNDFGLDSITITGSKAQAQAPTEEITVNISGLYHIAYGVDSEQLVGVNERFGQKTRLQIDSGSGFADARACFGDSYARGLSNSQNHITATAATSCMINLDAGDKLRVVSLREGDALGGTDVHTTANQSYLTIQSLTISNPPLQDSLGFTTQVEAVIIRSLTESLSFVDVVDTNNAATISVTESLDFSDPPVFIDKSGQISLTLVESLPLDDGTIEFRVQPDKQNATLTFVDELDYTLTSTVSFVESLSLDDGTVIGEIFVDGTPDFKIQQGTFNITAASTTGTITEGTDFDQCTGDCFIMQVSTRQTGMGDTSGGGNQFPNNVATRIENVDGLTNPSGTITFEREGTTNDNRITWQIIEYVGGAGGANEMDVLDTGVCIFGGTDISCTGSSISGGAADDNDVAVIVTGVSNPDNTAFDWESHLVTTEWKGASNVPVFNRTSVGTSDAIEVSYAVVEFTGKNWNLQRVEHTGSDLGLFTEETIEDVGDLSRAFILQAQQRNADSTTADGLCETGERVHLSDTTTLEFRHEFGTTACVYDSQMEEVVWVLSNSDTEAGTRMIVDHQQPSDQLNTSGSEEENWERSTSLTYGLDETAIFGFTANSDGQGEAYPRGTVVATLEDSSTIDFWQSDVGQEIGYSYSIVQWPRSQFFSFVLSESLSLSDTLERDRPYVESVQFIDVVETTKDAAVSLTEELTISDPPIFIDRNGAQFITVVESLSFDDGTVETQVQPIVQNVSLGFTDVLTYNINEVISLSESLPLDDGSVLAESFVASNPDYKIQHGTFTFGSGLTSDSIDEGVDYAECTNDCFIMQVSTRQTGMGRTSGGGNQNVEDVTTYISNDAGLNVTGGQITFTRDGTTNDNHIAWQIIEYIGPAGGSNEMKVHGNGTVTFGTSDTGVAGAAISQSILDDDDVAVIITGISGDAATNTDYDAVRVTSGWNAETNQPYFNRTATSSVTVNVSYSVVEFTGISWNLQRIEHTGIDAPFPTQTQTIEDVGDLSRAFILQAQQRNADGGVADNICETGERVWLSETNELSFSHEFGTDACTFNSNMEEVVWILSNTNDAPGKRMIVEHQQPTDQLNTSGSEQENWQRTIASLTYGTDETGIFGLTSSSDGTDTSHPRGTIIADLTDSSTVDFWQSDSGEEQGYAFSVVQWPRSRIISLSVVESLPFSDIIDPAKSATISLTESLNFTAVVDPSQTASVSLTESLNFTAVVETTQVASVTLTESLNFTDAVDPTSDISVSLTDSFDFIDVVIGTKSATISLTESLNFTAVVDPSQTASVTLTESLNFTDAIETTQDVSVSLTESLNFTAVVDPTNAASVSLTESLNFTAVVDPTNAASVSLTESLNFTAVVDPSQTASVSLTESLNFTAVVDPSQTASVTLTESLNFTDAIETTQDVSVSLTESLNFTAVVDPTNAASVSLTESLNFTAVVDPTNAASVSLTESLNFTAVVDPTNAASVSLTESLNFTAVVDPSQTASVSLTESLNFTAVVDPSQTASVTLTESLNFTDAIETTSATTISLTESLNFTDVLMANKAASVSLTESLNFTAVVDPSQTASVTLTESLNFTDAVDPTSDISVSLTDSFDFIDVVIGTKSATISLTESLNFTAVVDPSQTASVTLTESLNFTDAIETTQDVSVSLTESLNFTAVVDPTNAASVSLTESLNFTDVLMANKAASVSLTESLNFTAVVDPSQTASVSLTESLNFTAVVDPSQTASVTLTESLNFTAVVDPSQTASVTLTESLNFTAVVDPSQTASVTLTESLNFTDVVDPTNAASVSLTESLNFTDAVVATKVVSVTLTESLNFTDAVDPTNAASVSLTESLNFTAVVDPSQTASVSLTESLNFTAVVDPTNAASVSLTESLNFTAVVDPSQTASVSLTESLNFTAVVDPSQTASVTLTESLNFTDAIETTQDVSVSLTESLNFTAVVDPTNAASVSLTESLNFTAVVDPTNAASVSLTESLNFTAVVDPTNAASVSLTESLNFTAVVDPSQTASVTLTESLNFTAVVDPSQTASVSLTESLNFTAVVETTQVASVTLTESLNFTAVVDPSQTASVSLTESLNFTAVVDPSQTASVSLTESLNFTAVVDPSQTASVSLTESLNFTAVVETTQVASVTLTESLNFTAVVDPSQTASVTLTESLNFTDAVDPTSATTISLTESLNFTDVLMANKAASVSLTESLNFTAVVDPSQTASVTLTESLNFTDAVDPTSATTISLTESLNFTDVVDPTNAASVSLTESLNFTDAVVATKVVSVTLTESLNFTDAVDPTNAASVSLTESLNFTAVVDPTNAASVSLTESLNFTDVLMANKAASVSLTESLNFTAVVDPSQTASVSLTESLNFTAVVDPSQTASVTLTESLNFTAVVDPSQTASVTLTESLNFTAVVDPSQTASVTLTESLNFTDVVDPTNAASVSLTESLNFTDAVVATKVVSVTLTESLNFTDAVDPTNAASVSLTESLNFTAVVDPTNAASVSLTESLNFTDVLMANKAASVSLTESLNFTAVVDPSQTASVSLTESLNFTAVVDPSQTASVSLTESLNFTAVVDPSQTASVSLTESLNFTAVVDPTNAASVSLTESLNFTDVLMANKAASVSLTESLNFTAVVDPSQTASVSLTESLNFTAVVDPSQTASVTLTESLNFTDAVDPTNAASVSLTESLNFTAVVDPSQTASVSLTESLNFTAVVETTQVASVTLTESLNFTAVVDPSQTASVSLTESLNFTAVVDPSQTASVTLTESLNFTDVLMANNAASVSLTESLNFTDAVESVQVAVVTLSETLPFDDGTVEKRGGINIQIRDGSSTLLPGSVFRITPSPTNGTDTFTISDGDTNDQNGGNNGIIQVNLARFGDYQIEMITEPGAYAVTANSTSLSISSSANPSVLFTAISTATELADVDPIITTTSPILNSTSLETLEDLSTVLVNQTDVTVNSAEDLPEIISVGKNNTSGIANATANQVTIKVTTTTSEGITGSQFLDQLDMPTHTLPSNKDLTAVIAPIATSESGRQVVCSPSFEEVIPGQNMIFPVNTTVIPSIGGVSLLNITSSATASSSGTFDSDYACVEVDDKLISTPSLSSSGIDNELELFLDVKYRHEVDGNGFDWNNATNFANPGKITALVPKPTSDNIVKLSNGCADVEVHTLVGGSWVSTVDTIISNTPSSENTNYCEVVIESDHYSKKAISSKRTASPGGSSSSGDSGSSSSGSSGGGGGGGGGGGASGFAGILETPLSINEVSYDKCRENMVRILISSDAELPPTVTLYTAKLGTVQATLAETQPFAESNQITNIDRFVYEAPISEDELFFTVRVTEIGHDGEQNTVQTIIHADECSETIVVVDTPIDDEQVRIDRPRIFDTKFQIGTGPQQKSSIESVLYLDKQDLTVSAIIDSKSLLQRVELRTVPLGQLDQDYIAMRMNVTSLSVSDTSYLVTATLPSYFMVEPGLKYWIHVLDEEGYTIDSRPYEIGVKPTKLSNVSVEMDVPSVKAAGSPIKPEVYVFTNNAAAYGKVSLIADGEVVSERAQFFDLGQTKVTFDWDVPESDSYSRNELQGKVELYDSSISTASAVIHSHPKTLSMPASELASLGLIEIDGQLIAEPALLYSSNSDDNMQFRIIDPQGQCVIGGTEDCAISESTKDNRGGLTSIMYGDQVLRVRYSGAENALERFSITSIDPITQPWTITLETTDESMLQEAHATSEPIVKVKYRYHSETITVFSN